MKAKKYILRVSNKVTAIQWTGTNCDDVALFMGRSTFDYHMSMNDNTLKIDIMRVPVNDYIVHNPSEGYHTHMSEQEFNEKYKLIENKITMNNEKYNQLRERKNLLDAETKELILEALQQNGGRIIIPIKLDEDGETEYDCDTAITMYSDNGNPNINVAEIYTICEYVGSCDIKIDGIDNCGHKWIGLDVYSDHYSHILDFIDTALNPQSENSNSLIITYATFLANLDLIKKYDNPAICVYDKECDGLDKYKHEFDKAYENHLIKLNALANNEIAEFDKNSLVIEYACDLSESEMFNKYKFPLDEIRDEDGKYEDDYQCEFDGYYDVYFHQLTKLSQNKSQNEIDELWNKYVEKNEVDPMFATCQIQYLDTPNETQEVIIKMSSDTGEKTEDDDKVFYYCDSLNDLKSLTGDGIVDFKIISITSFTSEIK